jgi:VanZ family protein
MNTRLALMALAYAALLAYASLYPLTGWQADGVRPFGFLLDPWPVVVRRIDNLVNVLAYLPLGLLLALSLRRRWVFSLNVILATLIGALLSVTMESLQQYLPRRVPSQADLATNAFGALIGALLSSFLDPERFPGKFLAQLRVHWIKPGAHFDLGLIAVAAWALSQWTPFIPSFSVDGLRAGLAPLWHGVQDLSSFDVMRWGRYTLYLSGLALLVRTMANPGRPAVLLFFVFVAFVFACKVPVVGRELSLEAAAGALSAMALTVLWLGLRVRTVARIAALFIVAGLALAHLLPGAGSEHLSNWAPLRGPIDHPVLGLGSVLEILWPPAALGYLARMAVSVAHQRTVAWAGGAVLAAFLVAMDWPQQSLPIATLVLMAATCTLFGLLFPTPSADPVVSPPGLRARVIFPTALAWAGMVAVALLVMSPSNAAQGATLRVGPQQALTVPSAAAKVARDGDLVEIEAGVYAGDATVWRQNGLTIRGVGGFAHLRADGAHAEGKAIWVLKGENTTVENIEFSGARVEHRNGAGIRVEGAGLTVRNCRFHHNEMGILTGVNAASDILIERSEFSHNMRPDGHNHNVYIGTVRSFTLRSSRVHHATIGHNVKTRALQNFILYNRIMDERDGRSSYALEFPNGGLSFVIGNMIQQGPRNDNRTIVSFGAEGLKNPVNELHFVGNTVVNEDPRDARFLVIRDGTQAAHILNNVFAGPGEILVGPGELRGNARRDVGELAER